MATKLERIKLTRKSGKERFHNGGAQADFDLLDFWQWSASNLVDNTTRGILAEYLVAKALGISTERPREGWLAWDLKTEDKPKLRIEVKSAAFLQSWHQEKLSEIKFVVPPRKGWNPDTNKMETIPKRHAHVYVFALFAHADKATVDPFDLAQWKFFALSTRKLDERKRSQHSITLRSLEALAGPPVDFWHVSDSVKKTRDLVSP